MYWHIQSPCARERENAPDHKALTMPPALERSLSATLFYSLHTTSRDVHSYMLIACESVWLYIYAHGSAS